MTAGTGGGGGRGAVGGSSLNIQFKKEQSLQILDIMIRNWIIFFIASCVPIAGKLEWKSLQCCKIVTRDK
jgi:hypothetical protein